MKMPSPRIALIVAAAILAATACSKRLSAAQRQSIEMNLRQIATAADQYYLENGKITVTLDALTGPGGYLRVVDAVAGENYRAIKFEQGQPLEVTTASGEKVSYGR